MYKILHLNGYYEGLLDVKSITSGFEHANVIINKIKPTNGETKISV